MKSLQAQQFQQKAIHLIHLTQEGNYAIHPEGASFLSKIEQPIGIVSVAGLYRTGKSYLLNRMLLNRSSGFGVGSTINACTKGLWCWGSPIKGTTPDGQRINVIIIDSEGIGAIEQDQNHDTKIFTLAVLSASTFIYNSVGSIDENALQNLSLVVNLSKNIQIKSSESQGQEQVDPQQLAEYFPSFCWVVRDFSLQLVDGNGDTLTSNEYLERALALQKGFSDDIEDKNRIRRLLTAFFKNRQCLTLIRPLVNQAKLQKLQQLDIEQLRPEFVEQYLNLRKRVLNKIQPKKFRGKNLDGKMYLNTLNSYVAAINQGAVPNMDNAWSYMCQEKCQEIFQNSCIETQTQIKELYTQIPLRQAQLKESLEKIKDENIKKFSTQVKGMQKESQQMFQQLIQIIKLRTEEILYKNEKQSINFLKSFALKSFKTIEKAMTTNEFQKYQDYTKALNAFQTSLIQNSPDLPKRQTVFLEFIKKAAVQGAQLFMKKVTKQLQTKTQIWMGQKKNLEKIITQTKSETSKQIKAKKQQIKQLDEQNTDLLANLQCCKKEIEKIKSQEKKQQQMYKKNTQENRIQHQQQKEDLLNQIKQIKDLTNELQKDKYQLEKQIEKSQALSQLKLKQTTEELEAYKKKTQSLQTQIKEAESGLNGKIQSLSESYETQLSKMKQDWNQATQQKEAMLLNNQQLISEIERMKQDYSIREKELKDEIMRYKQKFNKFQDEQEHKYIQIKEEKQSLSAINQELKRELEASKQRMERQLQAQAQRLKHSHQQFEKLKAVMTQKVQFMKTEIKQMQEQSEAKVEFYQARIKKLEETNEQIRNQATQKTSKQTEMLYQQKLLASQKQFEQQQRQLLAEIQLISGQRQKLEFQLNIQKKNSQAEKQQFKSIVNELQNELSKQREKVLSLETQKDRQSQIMQAEHAKRIKQLEMKLQEKVEQTENLQRQQNNKSEETIIQLKNYYQLQREKLEEKIIKEKEKYEKKILEINLDFEQKLREQTELIEQQCQYLKQDHAKLQQQSSETISTLQHDLDLKTKSYENIQIQFTNLKITFQKKQIQLANRIQVLTQTLETEKENDQRKLSEVTKQRNKFEKQLMSTKHVKDETQALLKNKDEKIQKLKKQISQLGKQAQRIREQYRKKEILEANQHNNKVISYEKELALIKQEKQFISKKNEELQQLLQSKSQSFEDKIALIKEQWQNSCKALQSKRASEISQWESKYNKLKKQSKEEQITLSKNQSSLQKQLAKQKEKTANLEKKLQTVEKVQIDVEQRVYSELSTVKSTYQLQMKDISEKYEQLKSTLSAVESQKQQIASNYQKQKVLWINKNQYLQENRQKNKKQTTEKCKKFEEIIQKMESSKKQEKSAIEHNMNERIKNIEKKASQQIKQLTATYQRRQSQLEEKVKSLEVESRKLAQKVALNSQSSSEGISYQQRKIKELQENEKRLQAQLQSLKNVSKNTSTQTFSLYQKQKEIMKQKLSEKEQKLRHVQKLKQQYFFDLEKEKAKTKMQKESYLMKIQELKDSITKNERDLEKIQRENEKLKAQRKCSKINLGRYSINKSQFGGGHLQKSHLEQGSSFLNMSVASSIRDQRQSRSFSRAKQIRESREKDKDKENFKPLLDEQSLFNNQ